MRILKAAHLGMCFGVRDAIRLALHEAQRQPLTILGDLVHNDTVVSSLQHAGISMVRKLEEATTATVMITAHGASDRARQRIHEHGHHLMEATCPLVHIAHLEVLRLEREGFHPVIVGQRDHVEVRGLTEDLHAFDIILSEDDIASLTQRPRFGVASQTTQPIDRVRHLVACLRRRFPQSDVRFIDTVCQPTKQRQHAANSLSQACDVVIVIGGSRSNNTRELVATCRRHCARVYHVTGAHDLRADWFAETDTIGVTAGTSTPDTVIEEVEQRLQDWASALEPLAAERAHPMPERAESVFLHTS